MEINVQGLRTATVEDLENKKDFSFDMVKHGFNEASSTGMDSYYHHDEKILSEWATKQVDFADNKNFYEGYNTSDPFLKDMIDEKIQSGSLYKDKNGEIKGNFMMSDWYIGLHKDAIKGAFLYQGYDKGQRDIDFGESLKGDIEKYNSVHTTTGGEIAKAIGHIGEWFTHPETIIEFGSPQQIVTKGLLKKGAKEVIKTGAKAFGWEAFVAGAAESFKIFKGYGKADAYKRAGIYKSKSDYVKEIVVNATLAGTIRSTGSMVVDARTLRLSKTLSDQDQLILKQFDDSVASSLVRDRDSHKAILDEVERAKTNGVDIEVPTDIDIETRTDPSIVKNDAQEAFDEELVNSGDAQRGEQLNDDLDNTQPYDHTAEEDPFVSNTLDEYADEFTGDVDLDAIDREILELEGSLGESKVTVADQTAEDVFGSIEAPAAEVVKPKALRRHPSITYTHEDGRDVFVTKGDYNSLKAYQKNVRQGKTPTQKQMDTYMKHETFYDENEDMFAKDSTFDTYSKQAESFDKYADMSEEDLAEIARIQGEDKLDLYHGTDVDFERMDIQASKGNLGEAIYLTPDAEYAAKHGEILHEYQLDKSNTLDLSDRETVDALYKEWLGVEDIKQSGRDFDDYRYNVMSKTGKESDLKDFNEFLRSKGYDATMVKRPGQESPEIAVLNKDVISAKFGDNVAAGLVAGIEEDENGNITFDPAKFVMGMGGYTVAKEVLKASAKHPKISDKVNKWLDDIENEAAKAAGGGKPPDESIIERERGAARSEDYKVEHSTTKHGESYNPKETVADKLESRKIDTPPLKHETGNYFYHGSRKEFDSFDVDTQKKGSKLGRGFYFTPNLNFAESYKGKKGVMYQAQLEMKSPLNLQKTILTDEQIKTGLSLLDDYELKKANITREDILKRLNADKVDRTKNWKFIQYIDQFSDYDTPIGDIYKKIGFDGIIEENWNEFVVFEPTQIKNKEVLAGIMAISVIQQEEETK